MEYLKKGLLITLEGGDGAGKSTLLSKMELYFTEQLGVSSNDIVLTREPGGTEIAEEIREVLLKSGRSMNVWTELFLYEASRAEHVAQVLKPALEMKKLILCDRFVASTIAYQGVARNLGVTTVQSLNQLATQGIEPDLILWIKTPLETALKRMEKRANLSRLDAEKQTFHELVLSGFERAQEIYSDRFIVLDGSKTPTEIFEQLLKTELFQKLTTRFKRGTP
jgi:dTMP kinase